MDETIYTLRDDQVTLKWLESEDQFRNSTEQEILNEA